MTKNENFVSEELEQEAEHQELIKEEIDEKEKPLWYVIHTYSGYENKVKESIDKIIENREMYDSITEVLVPVKDMVEVTKAGQKKTVSRKIFPGYVFLKMIMNDETWYVVRNTRGVTSFVGPGSSPVPLTESEVLTMGIEDFLDNCDISIGDVISIKEGPFAKSQGVVKEVNISKRTVIVNMSFFGRETPVELDFHQIQQI